MQIILKSTDTGQYVIEYPDTSWKMTLFAWTGIPLLQKGFKKQGFTALFLSILLIVCIAMGDDSLPFNLDRILVTVNIFGIYLTPTGFWICLLIIWVMTMGYQCGINKKYYFRLYIENGFKFDAEGDDRKIIALKYGLNDSAFLKQGQSNER